MPDLAIVPLTEADRDWVERFWIERWGAPMVAGHGAVYRARDLPGFVAEVDGERVGLLTCHLDSAGNCEIVTIDSLRPARGIGTALIEAVVALARDRGCRRVWLITTNDNLTALRFYQKRGFVLVALHRNAVDAARRLKPEIPISGEHGIPIRDELELEYSL